MASDDFTDSDGVGLESHDSNWASASTPVTNLEINSNVCELEGNWQSASARYTASSEDTSEIVFKGHASGGITRHVAVRMGSSSLGYCLLFGLSGNNFTSLYVNKNGGYHDTIVAGTGSWARDEDHTVKIVVSGTTTVIIDAYVDDNYEGQSSDSSSPITSGNPGFYITETQQPSYAMVDDWNDGAEAPSFAGKSEILGGGII